MEFLYTLCWQIGGAKCVHPDELANHLTPRQVAGWLAWANMRPRGESAENIRTALLRVDIRQGYTDRVLDPADFMPFQSPDPVLPPEVEAIVEDFLHSEVPRL